jgi:hypothetical protein
MYGTAASGKSFFVSGSKPSLGFIPAIFDWPDKMKICTGLSSAKLNSRVVKIETAETSKRE